MTLPAEPPAPAPRRPYDPEKGLRGVMSATLVLEAITVLLAIPVAANTGGGVGPLGLIIICALALVEGAPLSRVADGLVMDRTTLTRNLRPLQRRGWVRIEAGEDRRERNLSLTRSGRAALERALPLWQQAQARLHERLGDAHWARLLHDLPRVVAVAQEATMTCDQG